MIGRNIAQPVADKKWVCFKADIHVVLIFQSDAATLELNLTQIQVLGQLWESTDITNFYNDLATDGTTVNPGSLVGNRMFYTNDYMVRTAKNVRNRFTDAAGQVHRGQNYMITLKMYSKRTENAECVNSQNKLGFHLADGAIYTYTTGTATLDICLAGLFTFNQSS